MSLTHRHCCRLGARRVRVVSRAASPAQQPPPEPDLRPGAARQLYADGTVLRSTPTFAHSMGPDGLYVLNKDVWCPVSPSASAAAQQRIDAVLEAGAAGEGGRQPRLQVTWPGFWC